ncbi:hypothetical protein [Agrobacterium rosae]|uniref:hypothetical protein n=1 Tax=Agrobacterium rosae TaxID=1972867 RepID=UPI003A7F6B73
MRAECSIRSHNQIIGWRGEPIAIGVYDGPDYVSGKLMEWAETLGIASNQNNQTSHNRNLMSERYKCTVQHQ